MFNLPDSYEERRIERLEERMEYLETRIKLLEHTLCEFKQPYLFYHYPMICPSNITYHVEGGEHK